MTINPVLLEKPQHRTYYAARDLNGGIGSMFVHNTDGTWQRGGHNGTPVSVSEVPKSIRYIAEEVTR